MHGSNFKLLPIYMNEYFMFQLINVIQFFRLILFPNDEFLLFLKKCKIENILFHSHQKVIEDIWLLATFSRSHILVFLKNHLLSFNLLHLIYLIEAVYFEYINSYKLIHTIILNLKIELS